MPPGGREKDNRKRIVNRKRKLEERGGDKILRDGFESWRHGKEEAWRGKSGFCVARLVRIPFFLRQCGYSLDLNRFL